MWRSNSTRQERGLFYHAENKDGTWMNTIFTIADSGTSSLGLEGWWNVFENHPATNPYIWRSPKYTKMRLYKDKPYPSIPYESLQEIRRPRPSPRQGRRLGPPQVWSLFLLACHYLAFRQALRPLPSVVKGVQACFEQALRPLPLLLRTFKPAVCHLKRCAAASSRHSRHCRLLLRAFKPAVCQASNA